MKNERFLRLNEIIGGDKPIIPISRSSFYAAIRRGELPQPKKVGRASLWAESQLISAMAALSEGGAA